MTNFEMIINCCLLFILCNNIFAAHRIFKIIMSGKFIWYMRDEDLGWIEIEDSPEIEKGWEIFQKDEKSNQMIIGRYGKSPVVFVVNNKGYTAERLIHDGPFNDIPEWRYHMLPQAFGSGEGIDVHTEDELESAMQKAAGWKGPGPLLVEVHVDPLDASEAFKLMSEVLRSH